MNYSPLQCTLNLWHASHVVMSVHVHSLWSRSMSKGTNLSWRLQLYMQLGCLGTKILEDLRSHHRLIYCVKVLGYFYFQNEINLDCSIKVSDYFIRVFWSFAKSHWQKVRNYGPRPSFFTGYMQCTIQPMLSCMKDAIHKHLVFVHLQFI